MGQTPKAFLKTTNSSVRAGVGEGASSSQPQSRSPEGRLFGGCEGPCVAGWAQRGGLPCEFLVKVADISAAGQRGYERRRQAPGQQGIPAQGLRGEEGERSPGEARGRPQEGLLLAT